MAGSLLMVLDTWAGTLSGGLTPLSQVAKHSDENRMTAVNLAIVMGPNLIWSNERAANLSGRCLLPLLRLSRAKTGLCTDMGAINGYVAFIVTHFEACFL